MSQLMQALGQLAGSLMQSSSQQSAGQGVGTAGVGGCTSYTPTSDPSQIGINPCVYYVSSAASQITSNLTGSSSAADQLLSELEGTNGTTGVATNPATGASISASPESGAAPLAVAFSAVVSQGTGPYSVDFGDGSAPATLSIAASCVSGSTCPYQANYTYQTPGSYVASLLDGNQNMLASIQITVNAAGTDTSGNGSLQQVFGAGSTSTAQTLSQSFANIPGVSGNILFSQSGGTIFASSQNPGNNSAVSGFYGSDTLSGGAPQGAIAGLCQKRPWSSDFLSNIIPPSFFDSLCQWGGFQVGAPPAATKPQVSLQQSKPAHTAATTTAATSTTPSVPAQATIWAVPSSVSLGARTSIFWNSQGVKSCTETSPGGSFSESSLSGAAATVPLTGSTTFTISCLDASGNPITNYVTVSISG